AWRAAAMWRTSWLSREVIALPLFMAGVTAWGLAHAGGAGPTLALGLASALLCVALFVCTGMIYATIRFMQEWAHPLTLVNFTLLGCASGFTLATALAAALQPALAVVLAPWALGLTLAGAASRWAALARNARLVPRSTLQTAIGVRHPRIRQLAMGFTGGSFNTREFFHGRAPQALRAVKWAFLLLAFVLPALALALAPATPGWLGLAFGMQFLGLLAERWFFFAQANHPQNLYYKTIS
ncbi:MAG: DmsC/YnfH family molybdoenzyme membrane anchor subunit, partial [Rubrivivax sp.]|nr:DmsC/YnfH family molybdoenzyme membrane anchor subunit [Rubrivivax sp.]